jgi:hypothetical protein
MNVNGSASRFRRRAPLDGSDCFALNCGVPNARRCLTRVRAGLRCARAQQVALHCAKTQRDWTFDSARHGPILAERWMTERKSDQGQQEPVVDRIRERAKDLIRDIVETLDGFVNPQPAPVPIPIRGGRRRY